MSKLAAALGVNTVTYEYAGKKYTLAPLDLEDYARYELFLEEQGWAALRRAREFEWLSEPEYREMCREFMLILSTFQLTFGTDDYLKSTTTIPGLKMILELSLAKTHEEFRRAFLHEECAGDKTLDAMARKDLRNVIIALNKLNSVDDSP